MLNYIDFKINSVLNDYTSDKIDDNILYESLDSLLFASSESVISSVKDFIGNTKTKTEDSILALCIKIYIKISELFSDLKKWAGKIFSVFMWILKKLENFKENHPIFFKIIIITILIILFTVIFISTSSASEGGIQVDLKKDFGIDMDQLNILLGVIDDHKHVDVLLDMQHKAMLVDIKDGVIDGSWGKEEITSFITKETTVLKMSLQEMINSGSSKSDIGSLLSEFQEAGEKMVGFTQDISKSIDGSKETIKIYSK